MASRTPPRLAHPSGGSKRPPGRRGIPRPGAQRSVGVRFAGEVAEGERPFTRNGWQKALQRERTVQDRRLPRPAESPCYNIHNY